MLEMMFEIYNIFFFFFILMKDVFLFFFFSKCVDLINSISSNKNSLKVSDENSVNTFPEVL
jgi:hypothetical protein